MQEESEDDDMLLSNIRSEPGKPLVMDIKLNGKPLTMELDTGAAVSLVSERTFQSLLPECQLRYHCAHTLESGWRFGGSWSLPLSTTHNTQSFLSTLSLEQAPACSGEIGWKPYGRHGSPYSR